MDQEQKKKYLWYAVGGVVGLLAILWYRRYKNNQAATQAANTSAAATPIPFGASAGNAMTDLATAPSISGSGVISSLTDWMNQVQSWASGSLGADPALVQNALQAYSNNLCLTPQEFNVIDRALGQFGAPPDAPFSGVVVCSGGSTPVSATAPSNPISVTTPTVHPIGSTQPPNNPPARPIANNPLSRVFPSLAQNTNGWFVIPGPTVGHILATILKVPYSTQGNTQYFNPAYVREISTPSLGSKLVSQGYTVAAINGAEFYNPLQKVTPGKGAYYNPQGQLVH